MLIFAKLSPLAAGARDVRDCLPTLRELMVLLLGCACMGLVYLLPAGPAPLALAVAVWLAFAAGVILVVGRDRFAQFFLLCFFFFPKKTVAANWWGGLLASHFGAASPVVLSFFDVVLMPTLVVAGLWLWRGSSGAPFARGYLFATAAFAAFAGLGAIQYLASDLDLPSSYAPVVIGGSLATAACYLFAKIGAARPGMLSAIFSRYAKWLVVILFVEYFLVFSHLMPYGVFHLSIDYRGGFRGAWIGYSVFISFFGMLGFVFAARDYLNASRWRDLAVAFMGLALILSTFERAALFASGLFVCLAILLDARHRRYGLLLAAMVMALATVEHFNGRNQQPASIAGASGPADAVASLSIVRAKGGDLLYTSSLSERFALQLRAVDVFLSAPVTGFGANSYYMTSASGVAPAMEGVTSGRIKTLYENIVSGKKQSNPHNLLAQLLAETGIGVLAFLYFGVVAPIVVANRVWRNSPELRGQLVVSAAILVALHFYYTFQSSPSYYFLFVIVAAAIAGGQPERRSETSGAAADVRT